MKLQIAFDLTDLDKALAIAKEVEPFCDIFEIGTVLIYQHGMEAIKKFKETFGTKTILADSKIIDRGSLTAELFSDASVDWFTVMAGTSSEVIHAACSVANNKKKKVMIDLLDSSSVGQSAMEAKNLGASALLLHQPYEEQDSFTFFDQWDMVKGNASVPVFVSAKITRETIDKVIGLQPDGIVIGTSIVQAENPAQEAEFFYNLCCK